MESHLFRQLDSVAARFRSFRTWWLLAVIGLVATCVGGLLLWMQQRGIWHAPHSGVMLALTALVAAGLVAGTTRVAFRDRRWVARKIEGSFPNLQQRLVTAVDQRPVGGAERFGFLQSEVLRQTLAHAGGNSWETTVAPRALKAARLLGLASFVALAGVVGGLILTRPEQAMLAAMRAHAEKGGDLELTVVPGNTEWEKGRSLLVEARFAREVPREALLVVVDGQGEHRIPMSRVLEDPMFAAHIAEVREDLTYAIEFGQRRSDRYRVTVFEYPELVRADANLEYPSYTGLPVQVVEDTRRVSAVEGTRLTWRCHLNKAVSSALLIDEQGEAVRLEADPNDPQFYSAEVVLQETRRWQLHLTDAKGRANKSPPQLVAKVVPNLLPELKLDLARDKRVSPLEEFLVKATAADDFGLRQYGLTYTLAGQAPRDIALGDDTQARETKQDFEQVLDFEALEAEPDQLLAYYFWAEDFGPDGQVRRALSDMYFAEVRPFEEIFRQGQQPAGGEQQQQPQGGPQAGGAAQQAEELVELQKQIINATWKVIRRELDDEPTAEFANDVQLLHDSQTTARQQAEGLGEQLRDGQSREHLGDVLTHMDQALEQLARAKDGPAIDALQPALAAEQSVYQSLLRLRAREHDVIRSSNSSSAGSQGGSSSRQMREQLEQLELENNENRYETQRQAQQQESDQQREVRQVTSRLRELARRQEDINKQLQNLQTALEQAETEEEQEEIRRQLKRLRDQQQQMLRDTDELLERMNEPQNRQQTQDARQQLEQARQNLQQSSESLEREQVPEALTAGTRAERELQRIQEDLRQQTANQFSEEMQEMRGQARDLERRQQELSEQLAGEEQRPQAGLRDSTSREQVRQDLRQQNERLGELLDRMQETIQEAEEPEPLLAEKLYDAFREAQRQQVGDKLEVAGELTSRGLQEQAREVEQSAREGITNLREGIETAAESVLGDETEALRRAVSELEHLANAVEEEIRRADPDTQNADPRDADARDAQDGQTDAEDRQNSASRQQRSESQARPDGEQGEQGEQGRDAARSPNGDSQSQGSAAGQTPEQQSEGSAGQQPDAEEGQPGQGSSTSPQEGEGEQGEGEQDGQSPQQGQAGGSPQDGNGQPNGGSGRTDDEQTDQPRRQGARPGSLRSLAVSPGGASGPDGGGGLRQFADESLGSAPITGDDFRDWSDRLRDVQEIIEDPELRAEAARIRQQARDFRIDYQRKSKEPHWSDVRDLVARPLVELRQRVWEELLRRSAERNAVVPIDRDPVPDEFTESVNLYYERLGAGKE